MQQNDGVDPFTNRGSFQSSASSTVTRALVICIAHSLVGVFLMGYNTSLFNVPDKTIRAHAAHTYIGDVAWQVVNSMLPIGALCGAAFSGTLMNNFGRKKMIMLSSVLNIIASLVLATSYYLSQLLFGRFLTGVASGVSTVVCSAYLNEISPVQLRGTIGTLLQLMVTAAIALSELLGKLWLVHPNWRYGFALPGMLCIVQLSASSTLLESPKWLKQKKRTQSAVHVLRKLRGLQTIASKSDIPMQLKRHADLDCATGAAAVADFVSIDQEIEEQLLAFSDDDEEADENQKGDNANRETPSLWKGIRQRPVIARIFALSISIHMLQQLSGINAVFYYSNAILESVGVENTYLGSVLLSVANFVAVLAVTPLMDKLGRRFLLLLSSIGMGVCCVLLTIMFNAVDHAQTTQAQHSCGILVIVCMVMYVIFFECGLGPIPWLIVAEFTPIEYRGSIISSSQVVNYGCNTIIAATTVSLLRALNAYGFAPFGCVCLVGACGIYFYIPETKQKNTKQIISEMDPAYYAS